MAMGSASGCVWRSPLSFSCSSASSTTSSSSNDDVADRMVKIELEAAEALADLAHLAVSLQNSGGTGCDSPGEWGSKGKRAKKRVKSESPPADSALNNSNPPLVLDSVPTSSDLAEVTFLHLSTTTTNSHFLFPRYCFCFCFCFGFGLLL